MEMEIHYSAKTNTWRMGVPSFLPSSSYSGISNSSGMNSKPASSVCICIHNPFTHSPCRQLALEPCGHDLVQIWINKIYMKLNNNRILWPYLLGTRITAHSLLQFCPKLSYATRVPLRWQLEYHARLQILYSCSGTNQVTRNPFRDPLRNIHIRHVGISKYTIPISGTYVKPHVKEELRSWLTQN